MSQFMIEFPHTQDNCLRMLDDLSMNNPDLLSRVNWGCMAGNHTGWAMVEAESAADALNMVPIGLRDSVRLTEMSRFTPDQIRDFHLKAA